MLSTNDGMIWYDVCCTAAGDAKMPDLRVIGVWGLKVGLKEVRGVRSFKGGWSVGCCHDYCGRHSACCAG